jgi:hypothetical protein
LWAAASSLASTIPAWRATSLPIATAGRIHSRGDAAAPAAEEPVEAGLYKHRLTAAMMPLFRLNAR